MYIYVYIYIYTGCTILPASCHYRQLVLRMFLLFQRTALVRPVNLLVLDDRTGIISHPVYIYIYIYIYNILHTYIVVIGATKPVIIYPRRIGVVKQVGFQCR